MVSARFRFFQSTARVAVIVIMAAAGFFGVAGPSSAQIVQNGGFNQAGGSYTLTNVNAPTSWTYATNVNGIGCVIANNNYAGCSYSVTGPGLSPNGGNFIAVDINPNSTGGTISQTLAGMVANNFYTLSFYAAESGGAINWAVSFGGVLLTTLNISSTSWALQSITFKTTAAEIANGVLAFAATNTTGLPPVAFLDGVKIPEPASIAALSLGALALAGFRRRKRAAA